jgi:hypothetical protein
MDNLYRYHLFSGAANYGSAPNFMDRDELPSHGYASLYAVTVETAQAIIKEGTTKGYRGVVYNEQLWLDVDNYNDAETVERRIKEMGYEYVGFDSGGRGAHFGITRPCAPSHLLPNKDKAWVKKWFPEADPSIYTHLHPFRLGGCVHERTGRRKELVSSGAGKALIIPRTILEDSNERSNTVSELSGSGDVGSIFSLGRVMAYTKAYTEGGRHAGLVRLAYALRDDYGASKELAFWWLMEANKLSESPKGEEEVRAAMRSIYE